MQNSYETRMLRVLDHIRAHPAGDLSLDALAEVAAMSRFHWHRVFRSVTGETVAQAVRRIRMHRAAASLLAGDTPVADVAASVGYPNLSSFSRAFTQTYGQSPAAFRACGKLATLSSAQPKGATPMFPIKIQNRPALRLAALSHAGDYQLSGAAFERVGTMFATRGLLPQARGMVGIYYDNPAETPVEQLRAHAGIIVADDFAMPDDLEDIKIPAMRCAVLEHKGSYATLAAAYDELYCDWLPSSGEEPADHACFEVYLNDPSNTPAAELRTDICLPLKG